MSEDRETGGLNRGSGEQDAPEKDIEQKDPDLEQADVQQLELNIEVPETGEAESAHAGQSGAIRFINARIVTPGGTIAEGSCTVSGGRIVSIDESGEAADPGAESGAAGSSAGGTDSSSADRSAKANAAAAGDRGVQIVDAAGGWLLPGFVDIHVHGGMGEDFMDSAKPGAIETIAGFHGAQGSTSMLATTMTATHDMIDSVLEAVWAYRQQGDRPGASIEGVHLEGPFISPKWPGAQNPDHISLPRTDWLEDWEARFPGLIRQLTLAPEREGALETVAWLRANGITAALGHTDASYEEVQAAVGAGLNHAVHTFNAMTPLHHRKPGAAGAVLGTDAITAEIIADGIHVHPGAVKLLAKMKSEDNLVLVTDAMSAAGLGDGDYFLGDLPVVVKDGVALTQGGALAGSRLTMAEGFRFLVRQAGLSVERASGAASAAPARQAGIYGETGSLEPGKRADLVLLDEELELRGVWAAGRKIG
ncbi:N-acetylglucosamine-6-phosphate deacetylase [Saccharibacillus sp. CPCC 101409]|uniref:N-acetylglucosamine-6-phosphate deacetylase n=1 Tax=Saccharibacillus sp. CPCC 101409 TaxID=3058041 RepID=UPI002673F0D9|nr:N-acetylglucosamine-6-phosphate deacetylase [Saccharibacillus sp. CPCC 101409]MDO3413374.1 N-acetylglucosamine-6-phosphate deacetylase [Saccharibacillus sp. CPCC 101409]